MVLALVLVRDTESRAEFYEFYGLCGTLALRDRSSSVDGNNGNNDSRNAAVGTCTGYFIEPLNAAHPCWK